MNESTVILAMMSIIGGLQHGYFLPKTGQLPMFHFSFKESKLHYLADIIFYLLFGTILVQLLVQVSS
jgi:hypothetical protein